MAASSVPRVVVTRNLGEKGQQKLKELVDANRLVVDQWDSDDAIEKSDFLERVGKDGGCDGILCLLTDRVDGEVLDKAGKNLKVVSSASVGVNHIDVAECTSRGIAVGNTPGVLTDATADLAVALLLATARKIPAAAQAVKDGEWKTWKPFWLTGKPVGGSTVGIVGLGRIGAAIAKRLSGFDCKLLYTGASGPKDRIAEPLGASFVSMDDLLAESDYVVLACALTPSTTNLLSTDQFKRMKRDAVLVNIARGEVVDQEALAVALQSGEIGAAGLDVTVPEPIPADDPLLSLPNCLIVPHIGSATQECREAIVDLALQNLCAVLLENKEPPHPVK